MYNHTLTQWATWRKMAQLDRLLYVRKDVTFWLAQRSNKERKRYQLSQWVMDILWWTANNLLVLSLYFTMLSFPVQPLPVPQRRSYSVFACRYWKRWNWKRLACETSHDYTCALKWYGSSQKIVTLQIWNSLSVLEGAWANNFRKRTSKRLHTGKATRNLLK